MGRRFILQPVRKLGVLSSLRDGSDPVFPKQHQPRRGLWSRAVRDCRHHSGLAVVWLVLVLATSDSSAGSRRDADLATRAAERVIETGKMLQLEPMPALVRRWVHIALREHPDVATQSIGEEPNRRVVVVPRSS